MNPSSSSMLRMTLPDKMMCRKAWIATLVEEGHQLKNAFSEEFEWVYVARDGLEAGLYAAERLLER